MLTIGVKLWVTFKICLFVYLPLWKVGLTPFIQLLYLSPAKFVVDVATSPTSVSDSAPFLAIHIKTCFKAIGFFAHAFIELDIF